MSVLDESNSVIKARRKSNRRNSQIIISGLSPVKAIKKEESVSSSSKSSLEEKKELSISSFDDGNAIQSDQSGGSHLQEIVS